MKIIPSTSVSPFYRFFSQNGGRYFAPYLSYVASEAFDTTDDYLSKFNSSFEGTSIRTSPSPHGVFVKKSEQPGSQIQSL